MLRILITTDNHLGYAENDAVIGNDSFRNFEEALQIATEEKADLVLLGGDLFHESNPSKHTTVQLEKLLAQYCFDDDDVLFKIVGDQSVNFAEGRVNFDNPHLNVGLPVFTIHGNHDYPQGESKLSAVDIPSASGLLNYFGKEEISEDGSLTIRPVIIEKGDIKVALYGLGHIADQRVGTVFRNPGAVKWIKASDVSPYDNDSCFNMMVIHQNRVRRGFQNTHNWIEDRHLAEFKHLDFVLWGHEHQCITETQPSGVGNFEVLQPGSTVATSLAEGESLPKHVFLLEICVDDGDIKHRVIKHRLQKVRPFSFDTIVLSEQPRVYSNSDQSVKECIRWQLETMANRCQRENSDMLPLVRLRIDYTGYDMVRTQEINQKFAGRVANPEDMLLWFRKTQRKEKGSASKTRVAPEVQDPGLMDELIATELQGSLKVLSTASCARAFRSVMMASGASNVRSMFASNTAKIKEELQKIEVANEDDMKNLAMKISKQLEEEGGLPNPPETASSSFRRGRSLSDGGSESSEEETRKDSVDSRPITFNTEQSSTTRTRVSEVLRAKRGRGRAVRRRR